MARLKKVQKPDIRPVTVNFDGEVLNMKIDRQKYTPRLERQMKEAIDENLPLNMLVEFLHSLVTEWDLEDVHPDDVDKPEDKQRMVPVPLTRENIGDMGVEVLQQIADGIIEAQRPNQTNSEISNDTF